jgi:uracil-DNA glycosylase
MDPMSVQPSSGPERNSPGEYSTDRVDFWVPFSLIRNDKGANADFFEELSLHYNLYITDIYKLFFYVATNEWDDKNNKYKFLTSNSRPEYKKIRKHAEILKEEVKIIQPHCIITLGNNSRDALLKISDDKTKQSKIWLADVQEYIYKDNSHECRIISSPHISTSANGARGPLLKNEKYNSINEINETKKMARIIISKIESIK